MLDPQTATEQIKQQITHMMTSGEAQIKEMNTTRTQVAQAMTRFQQASSHVTTHIQQAC